MKYTVHNMAERYDIEIEPEVRQWLDGLSAREYRRACYYADLLAENATTLGEPVSRHLSGPVRELRFALGPDHEAIRLTYWVAPNRTVVLLTVFRKTKMRETSEVQRALWAHKRCAEQHEPAVETYEREDRT